LSCRLIPLDARPVISAAASARVSKAAELMLVAGLTESNHVRRPGPSASAVFIAPTTELWIY
jgi:hypothetical protein